MRTISEIVSGLIEKSEKMRSGEAAIISGIDKAKAYESFGDPLSSVANYMDALIRDDLHDIVETVSQQLSLINPLADHHMQYKKLGEIVKLINEFERNRLQGLWQAMEHRRRKHGYGAGYGTIGMMRAAIISYQGFFNDCRHALRESSEVFSVNR